MNEMSVAFWELKAKVTEMSVAMHNTGVALMGVAQQLDQVASSLPISRVAVQWKDCSEGQAVAYCLAKATRGSHLTEI